MKHSVWKSQGAIWRLALVTGLVLLGAAGCDTYYIPPPPESISLAATTNDLVISALNTDNQVVPSQLPLQGAISNGGPNSTIVYSVGQEGNYVAGGNAIYGFVTPDGVYTAPLVVPTPNEVVIQAADQNDPTETATWTLTLENPTALVTGVSPSVVTAGSTATFDITGTNFDSGATIDLSGAGVTSTQLVSSTEMKATANVQQPGMLGLSVINPYPFGAPNSFLVRSLPTSPASSSAIAVTVGPAGKDANGNPVTATKAYVPRPGSLAVVNLDSNQQINSVLLPPGYVPSMVAADPAEQQVVVASTANNTLLLVNTNLDEVASSLSVAVAGTATVNGTTCGVCAMVLDSTRHTAILDTAAGLITVNLDSGSASAPLAAPSSLSFAYDPISQRAFVPYASSSGSGVKVVNLQTGTIEDLEPAGALFGTATSGAAWDATTGVLTTADTGSSAYLDLNLNNAQTLGTVMQAPAAPFTVTSACGSPWRGLDLDLVGHLGWLANLGSCIAVAALPQAAENGTPAPPLPLKWARVPADPNDGLSWQATPLSQDPTLAAYTGADGSAYGLALRADGAVLLKVNLAMLQAAPAFVGGADSNQVDPTQVSQNGSSVSALTYIPLH
ncbi:MAG: IPT/TIG domain-containing protein [Terriglobales bacterium]